MKQCEICNDTDQEIMRLGTDDSENDLGNFCPGCARAFVGTCVIECIGNGQDQMALAILELFVTLEERRVASHH